MLLYIDQQIPVHINICKYLFNLLFHKISSRYFYTLQLSYAQLETIKDQFIYNLTQYIISSQATVI